MDHINGQLDVRLLSYTQDASDLLILSKNTRHMTASSPEAVKQMAPDVYQKELTYALNSIGGPLEFVEYVFLIGGVTRAWTHQAVRHRVCSFAQQSMRVTGAGDFAYMIPDEIAANSELRYNYVMAMDSIRSRYGNMEQRGGRPQDMRGILPTNILTNIMMKINLRALVELLNVRLCIRSQGEFQEVAKRLKALVVGVHPWAAPKLGPACLVHGKCKYPYWTCPVSTRVPALKGLTPEQQSIAEEVFGRVSGFDPQPKAVVFQKEEPYESSSTACDLYGGGAGGSCGQLR